jgi:hypothetical protein
MFFRGSILTTKEIKSGGKPFLAEFISKLTNPCILSVVMLLAILLTKSERLIDLFWWITPLFLLLVALPIIYVYLRIFRNPVYRQARPDLTLFLKRHPKDILALGVICGLPCWLALKYLSAPILMLDTMAALLAISLVIAVVNLSYHASFHLAAITTLVYMAIVSWGYLFIASIILIPVVAWAKYQIKDHTVLQLVAGFILATAVTSIILYVS